jgi:uncharacterized protein YgbK (DUF1537 family)
MSHTMLGFAGRSRALIETSTPSIVFNIVTKSGGFGPPDFLERIIR